MGRERKKQISRVESVYLIIAAFIFCMVLVPFLTDKDAETESRSRLRQISFSGVCQTADGGEELPLSDETLRDLGACRHLILTGHFDGPIAPSEQVFLYLRRINLKVYQNNALIYSYGKENLSFPILKTGGNVWVDFYTPGIGGDDSIKIVLDNPYPANTKQVYSLFLERMYVGDKMQLFTTMLKESRLSLPASIVIFLMGVILMIVMTTMKFIGMEGVRPMLRFGHLMAACGLWMMIDFSYISLISPHAVGWDVLETLLYIHMPILALLYIRDYMATDAKKYIGIFVWVLLIYDIAYIVLQGFGILDGEIAQEGIRIAVPVILLGTAAAIAYEMRSNSDKVICTVFASSLLFILFCIAGYCWYTFTGNYSVDIFNVGFCVLILVQYGIALRRAMWGYRKAQKTKRMERELTDNKAAMMLSQIQPHFLYNSISCIRELCLSNPGKAHTALAQFSHFLRGNMDSLNSNSPIPFTRELSHVKNYLALEQLRFEERLTVNYHLETTEFSIPALTLQPVVENAVCYGIGKKSGGGTLVISTREEKDCFVVTVSDNGVGFEEKHTGEMKGGRSHVGMSNVRERLKGQCGGTIEVKSILGEGTVVSMKIPKG